MSTWRRGGAAVRLLAVLCVTAGCVAAQRRQREVYALDRHRELIRRVDRLESQTDTVNSTLKSGVDTLNSTLKSGVDTLNSTLESRMDTLFSRLESRLTDALDSRLAPLESRLDGMANQTASLLSQFAWLAIRLDQVEEMIKPRPRDCSELPEGATTGVYDLWPRPDHKVPAFCDMDTDGGSWTVFQRRDDVQPRQNFFLRWEAYQQGFGDLRKEFWWGLEHLWTMTSVHDRQYELRIDLEDFDGNKRYAVYQGFRISSEEDGFRLSVSNYTGNAGDDLTEHANTRFSTRDRDHDDWSKSCANFMKAAWWYADCTGGSHLNGQYLRKGTNSFTGIWWLTWKGWGSLMKTEMKIRPAKIIHRA